jgi:glycosyltransferase involved in cell wall biosynthesis
MPRPQAGAKAVKYSRDANARAWETALQADDDPLYGRLPLVTVVIPVKDDEEYIGGCLSCLERQGYPRERTEIIVVDGLSRDATRGVVEGFIERLGRKEAETQRRPPGRWSAVVPYIRMVDNPKGQRTSALNIGIKEARGELIMRMDARTTVEDDYLERCVRTSIATGADNVGGVQRAVAAPDIARTGVRKDEARRLTQLAVGAALSHPFGVGNARFRLGGRSGYVDTVYPGCFRRKVFDRVGLFDEGSAVISEDSDMNQRIREAGGKVYMDAGITAYYHPRDSFGDLWRLYFRYGGAKAGNLKKRRRLTATRQMVPPLFLLALVFLPPLGAFEGWFLRLWTITALLYAATDVTVSLLTATTLQGPRLRLFGLLIRIFPVMHVAWAAGFWWGLLKRQRPGVYWGN